MKTFNLLGISLGVILSLFRVVYAQDSLNVTIEGELIYSNFCRDVDVQGEQVYVIDWHNGLLIGDITDPTNPQLISSLYLTEYPLKIDAEADFAYIIDEVGTNIVDVSDPIAPQVLSSIQAPFPPEEVFYYDNYLYVCCSVSGLQIIDISDPLNPQQVTLYNLPGNLYDVTVMDSIAYLAWGNDLRIVNISNPSHPVLLGSCTLPGWAMGVDVEGNYAYVADWTAGVFIIDISNYLAPQVISGYHTPGCANAGTYDEDHLYISCDSSGVRILSVSNPYSPVEVGSITWHLCEAWDTAYSDDYLYAALFGAGMRIIDVSMPSTPFEVSMFPMAGGAAAVALDGNFAYVGASEGGLQIFDISNPTVPNFLGLCDISIQFLVKQGNYVYAAHHGWIGDPFIVFNVSNPEDPFMTSMNFPYLGGNFLDLAISENYLYVSRMEGGFQIHDLGNPADPPMLSFTYQEANTRGLDISENLLYTANSYDGLKIYDVSNPLAPVEVGCYDSVQSLMDVAVAGDFAFTADFDSIFQVLNVANPASPYSVATFHLNGRVLDLFLLFPHLFVSTSMGMQIFNVSDPIYPMLEGYYINGSWMRKIAAAGVYAFVPNYNFDIFHCSLVSAVNENSSSVSSTPFYFSHPHPNPFNQSSVISYQLSMGSWVNLMVYDITGREIATLVEGFESAGSHQVVLDANDLSSGVYFVQLESGEFSQTRKLLLIK